MKYDITPVELRGGRYYKRNDLYRHPSGVNGVKWRACQWLVNRAMEQGYRHIVSAASVHSPQNAMAAVAAMQLGLSSTIICGGTTLRSAQRHASIRLAMNYGANLVTANIGYNPALQKFAAEYVRGADSFEGRYWQLRYGVTPWEDDDREVLRKFYANGVVQALNVPESVETVAIPFGTGNSALSAVLGLGVHPPPELRRVVLMGIGPDRREWLRHRVRFLGERIPFPVDFLDLTHMYSYSDKVHLEMDGIRFHPTYEAKCIEYLNARRPSWWKTTDGSTCFWIVGGPID